MPASYNDQKKARLELKLRIQRQIAFASGLFQDDLTVRTLLESLAEGVVIIDNSGTILFANTRIQQMFGYPKEALIGKPLAVLVPERFHKDYEEHQAQFFAEPRSIPMVQTPDLVGLRRDGSEFPLEMSLGFLETINGVLALAFVSDITIRKQFETRLRESEELFHLQIESVKNYAIFTLDSQGFVLNWNAGAERLKGYRAEEIIGKHFSCFYPEEDRNAGKPDEELKKAAAEGHFAEEGWRIRKDGSGFWADVIITALHDESGNLWGFSKVTRDITGRKKAEAEIQEAREYAENIVETVREPLVVLNSDLKILTANHSFYDTFQVAPEDTIGNFIYDLGNRQWDIPKLRVLFEEILPHDTVFNGYEVEHDFLDIGRKIILLNARQIFREDIGSHIILLAMEDITERKFAEEQIKILNTSLAARASELEEANRELETFNYSVAHDLRTPLTAINGTCQAIQALCGDMLDEQCKGYLQMAYEGTLRMNRLIEALLQFAHLARVEPKRGQVELSSLALEVATELKLSEPQRQVTFRVADGVMVDGDANLLRVVLDNLLGNAWKYTAMREGAVIEFGVIEIDGESACFVRDNGAGFDMKDVEKLFIPFQRLPGAEEFRGFGIGLPTVERIIRRHGGRIWAESEPGKGATFYFTLANQRE
jgi:PAS domain S-box-containing protein